MKKRWGLLLAFAFVALSAFFIFFLSLQREPMYGGKPFYYWMAEYGRSRIGQEKGTEAILAMGEPVVPFLMMEVKKEEPGWRIFYRRKYPALPPMIQRYAPRPKPVPVHSEEAANLLAELGPVAHKAMPELGRIAQSQSVGWLTNRVVRSVKISGLPMVTITNNLQVTNRVLVGGWTYRNSKETDTLRAIIKAIGRIGGDDPDLVGLFLQLGGHPEFHLSCFGALSSANLLPAVRAAFPLARQSLASTNEPVRQLAVVALGQLVAENAEVTVILTRTLREDPSLLVKCSCITALAQARGKFELVLPALVECLAVDSRELRSHCTFAFEQLQSRTPVWPALVAALKNPDPVLQMNVAGILGDLGPGARAAAPALAEMKRHPYYRVQEAAVAALKRIEVGTKGKAGTQ